MRAFACSVCGARAGAFDRDGNAIVYSGVTGRRCRTEEVERVTAAESPKDLDAIMKEDHWREIAVYTIGEPRFALDAYCPECDAIYCKDHLVVAPWAHAGYGEQITATCPRGHKRVVYDDYREP